MRARVLNAQFLPVGHDIAIDVESPFLSATVAPLIEGGFALTWNDRDRILLCLVDDQGAVSEPAGLAKSTVQIPNLRIEQFPSGEIAISWQHGMVIVRPDLVALMCASSHDAWDSVITPLLQGSLLRVDTSELPFFNNPPIYVVNGTVFDAAANQTDKFRYVVPSKIIADTYAHPQQLSAIALGQRFLLLWTDLAHSLGNAIQALVFEKNGTPVSELITLVQAAPDSHVESASVTLLSNGGLLLAWSYDAGNGYSFVMQEFSHTLSPIHDPFVVAAGPVAEGGSISRDANGSMLALWTQEGKILVTPLTLVESQPSV